MSRTAAEAFGKLGTRPGSGHADDALRTIEEAARHFLDDEGFRRRFPAAYERLKAAELPGEPDPLDDLSAIGHNLREVRRQLAAMIDVYHPAVVEPEPPRTRTRNRLRLRPLVELHGRRFRDRRRTKHVEATDEEGHPAVGRLLLLGIVFAPALVVGAGLAAHAILIWLQYGWNQIG